MTSTTSQQLSIQIGLLLQKAFRSKKNGSIQEALDAYKEIDNLTKEPEYCIEINEKTLNLGDLEYGLAFRILDYGNVEDAKACWQESIESAKTSGNRVRSLFCVGRLCLLDICHLKNVEEGKLMAEKLSNEYRGGLFFAIIDALAQTTEEEFRTRFSKIPNGLLKKATLDHLDVFKRDCERAEKMMKSGVDEDHWRKIAERYRVIVKKVEEVMAKQNERNERKKEERKENREGGWRSNWTSSKN